MTDDSGRTSKTVEYALHALVVFGDGAPRTPAAAAAELGLSKSAAQRLLATLHRWGLLLREEDGRYSLGPTLTRWATEWSGELADLAHPFLDRLATHTAETAILVVRSQSPDTAAIVVAQSSGSHSPLRVEFPVGATHRMDESAAGVALLAWSDDDIQERIAQRAPERRLGAQLETAREAGYAIVHGGRHGEMIGIGAPIVLPSGEVVGAVAAVAPTERSEALIVRGDDVVATALDIARAVTTSAEYVPDSTQPATAPRRERATSR